MRFENPDGILHSAGKIAIADKTRLLSTLDYLCELEKLPVENKELKNRFLNDIFAQIEAESKISHMQKDEIVRKAHEYLKKTWRKR